MTLPSVKTGGTPLLRMVWNERLHAIVALLVLVRCILARRADDAFIVLCAIWSARCGFGFGRMTSRTAGSWEDSGGHVICLVSAVQLAFIAAGLKVAAGIVALPDICVGVATWTRDTHLLAAAPIVYHGTLCPRPWPTGSVWARARGAWINFGRADTVRFQIVVAVPVVVHIDTARPGLVDPRQRQV